MFFVFFCSIFFIAILFFSSSVDADFYQMRELSTAAQQVSQMLKIWYLIFFVVRNVIVEISFSQIVCIVISQLIGSWLLGAKSNLKIYICFPWHVTNEKSDDMIFLLRHSWRDLVFGVMERLLKHLKHLLMELSKED